MEDKIKLFLEYMKKEKELRLEWDKEDGIDVNSPDYKLILLTVDRARTFIAYRNIRIEEAWFSKLNKGKHSRAIEEKAYDYDEKRCQKHALALNSLNALNKFGEEHGLKKFYDGPMLERSDIENYTNISVRNEETAFFLQFIDKLGRTTSKEMEKYFEEVGIEQGEEESSFIKELQSNISSVESAYAVEEPPLEERSEIKFKDEEIFGMQLD